MNLGSCLFWGNNGLFLWFSSCYETAAVLFKFWSGRGALREKNKTAYLLLSTLMATKEEASAEGPECGVA